MRRRNHLPLIPWDAPDGTRHDHVAWRTKLDDRYLVEVRHTYTRCGELRIFDHRYDDDEIASWDVSVGLGPEDDEIADWLGRVRNHIDNVYDAT